MWFGLSTIHQKEICGSLEIQSIRTVYYHFCQFLCLEEIKELPKLQSKVLSFYLTRNQIDSVQILLFDERGKLETFGSKVEKEQTQPTYGVELGNGTQVTLVEGENSHHYKKRNQHKH